MCVCVCVCVRVRVVYQVSGKVDSLCKSGRRAEHGNGLRQKEVFNDPAIFMLQRGRVNANPFLDGP